MANPEDEKSLQEELSLPILLGDRVIKAAQEAQSSKSDCSDVAKQVERLSAMLRAIVRLASATTTSSSLYDRPIRRILADVSKNLERALTLLRKCKKHGALFRHVFSITSAADFRKLSNLLESSIGDMKWLLSILDSSDGATSLSLPPIASNDPILAWVWSFISALQMGQLKDRADAANELASVANDNDRNKIIIMEEGGIPPLLKLLKEAASPDAQIAAANALVNIASDQHRVVEFIVESLGVPIIVQVLGDSPIRVQVAVANLVSKMAELGTIAQEEFVRVNVTRPLISLLCMDTVLDRPSIHSLVLNLTSSSSGSSSDHRKEREGESYEMKKKIKTSCAEALWKLSKGSEATCRKITETKGLLCLAKLIESETAELQFNCLMAVMEITVVAEFNAELRRVAFKPTAPAAKAVLDQLLRLIQNDQTDSVLQIPAIKSIGSLARNFPAKAPQIVGPLVAQLGSGNVDVAIEAAIALRKFVCPDNYNFACHSKAIIMEFDGVPSVMRLLQRNDRARKHGLVLLCYLAMNVGDSKALEQARALSTLKGLERPVLAQHPEMKELMTKAIDNLILYQTGAQLHRQVYNIRTIHDPSGSGCIFQPDE
ncbi:ARM REPEAT PROTEIN INTERACTING WITH ABF2 [Senna tora]|uniref:ARM REPEAT PROTEIN INTERACTING WITH ABF2 n=1 Tax=Senna tora TaxID=362788 RepID=A0A834X6F1_9FABA|nr:ARM REPEAT PROTEIN INTERACTING WITH ABF2 [Senna tora]